MREQDESGGEHSAAPEDKRAREVAARCEAISGGDGVAQ